MLLLRAYDLLYSYLATHEMFYNVLIPLCLRALEFIPCTQKNVLSPPSGTVILLTGLNGAYQETEAGGSRLA